MLHLKENSNWITRRVPHFCGVVFAAVLALLPISAGAQCANWDANGHIVLRQAFSKAMDIKLVHKGKLIIGTADSIVKRSPGSFAERRMAGTVDGTLDGDNFNVQIYWTNGQTGVYNGKVLLSGRLDGEAYEKRSPNVRIPWHTDGVLKCATPPPVIPKVIRSSGKAKSAPKPEPPKPPFITAGKAIFPTPYVQTGFVILTWDAGTDHPNAELWLKTPGGAYAFAKHSKGGLQVPVERGRAYEYMVTEAGKILAGVTFVAQ